MKIKIFILQYCKWYIVVVYCKWDTHLVCFQISICLKCFKISLKTVVTFVKCTSVYF